VKPFVKTYFLILSWILNECFVPDRYPIFMLIPPWLPIKSGRISCQGQASTGSPGGILDSLYVHFYNPWQGKAEANFT
jgi:hypothetical protein